MRFSGLNVIECGLHCKAFLNLWIINETFWSQQFKLLCIKYKMARTLVKWSSLFQLKKEGRGTPGANKPNYVKK